MEKILSEYTTALDELNVLTETSYRMASSDEGSVKAEQVEDDVLTFLITAYLLGVEHASVMLDYEMRADADLMRKAVYQVIEGKTFEDRVVDHIKANDLSGLKVLVESEFHRIYNAAVQDGGERFTTDTHLSVNKIWIIERDERVRETHRYLESHVVALDEYFFTFDGDYAQYPGQFTRAENNVNCRCIVQLSKDV